MRFLDLFSGIGGFRLGLEMAGHECVGHVEIDKYANQSYRAIHKPKEREFFHEDITTITDESIRELRDRGIDIIAGGFPCQAFSIAGKRSGFEDARGTLFFNIAKLAKEIQPKYLFLENVKGLLNHDRGDTFEVILRTLDELGYDAEWQVLNSKHFGVPQNRERVFIIGHLRGGSTRKVFPIGSEYEEIDELQGQHVETITTRTGNSGSVGTYIVEGERLSQKVVSFDRKNGAGKELKIAHTLNSSDWRGLNRNQKQNAVVIPVLTPDRAEKRQNGRRFKENGDPMFTLTAQDRHGVMIEEATKQGYAIAEPGDSINLEQPNSKTRRGRVGKGIANTITTSCNQVVVEPLTAQDVHGALLAPDNWSHKAGDGTATRKYRETDIHPALVANTGSSQATYCKKYIDGMSDKYSFAKKKAQEMLDEKGFLPERFNPYNSQEIDEVSPTLTTGCGHSTSSSAVLMKQPDFRIRKLTPKECWRLQGFPDWAFERARAVGVSDSQLYKQAGNSVTVNVVYEIAKRLK